MTNVTTVAGQNTSCENLYRLDSDPAWSSALVSCYVLTAGLCWGMAKFVRDRTDVAHPVFGILLHEVSVLSAAAPTLLAVYLGKKGLEDSSPDKERVNFLVWILTSFVMFFHQISWLLITCIR